MIRYGFKPSPFVDADVEAYHEWCAQRGYTGDSYWTEFVEYWEAQA